MNALASIRTEPSRNAAPEKCMGAPGLVKYENKPVINGGPAIEVRLIKLVSAPCNSPCSSAGTFPEIIDCNAGPEIPPKQYGIKNTNIIQL